jgi:Tol biopolymer transport system component
MAIIKNVARLTLALVIVSAALVGACMTVSAGLPRGKELAFVGWAGDAQVAYVMDINHGLSAPLMGRTFGVVDPIWSPDGDRLVFMHSHQVYIVNGDGSGLRLLKTGTPDESVTGFPHWSPDGRQVSIATREGPLMVSVDGGQTHPIPIDPRLNINPQPIQDFVWSPDGRRLAFAIGAAPFAYGIIVMDAAGSTIAGDSHEVTQASFIPSFAWSPDGTRIATLVVQQDRFHIQLADLTGSAPPVVLPPPADAGSLRWSPDGSQIAFVSETAVCVVSVGSGASNCLTPPINAFTVTWSPDGRQMAVTARAGYYLMNADGSDLHLIAAYEGPVLGLSWRP